jgi:hypothetical protein
MRKLLFDNVYVMISLFNYSYNRLVVQVIPSFMIQSLFNFQSQSPPCELNLCSGLLAILDPHPS